MALTITRELARLVSPRFLSKIEKRPGDPCWHWTGNKFRDGYGAFKICANGRAVNVGAHRLSYVLHCGLIPEGLVVRHSCDVRDCVNPVHLLVGTVADNQRDMVERGRSVGFPGETHPRSRLSSRSVRFIRFLSDFDYTHAEIARLYNISPAQIGKIVRREQWAHLD